MTSSPVAARAASQKLGMWVFLVTDAISFAALLIAYAVLRAGAPAWPAAASRLNLPIAIVSTFALLGSSLTVALAGDAAASDRLRAARGWVGATLALGLAVLGLLAWEYAALARHGVGVALDQAASTFFVVTGWHAAHLAAGVVALAAVGARRGLPGLASAALFWQLLAAMWILIFTFVYLV